MQLPAMQEYPADTAVKPTAGLPLVLSVGTEGCVGQVGVENQHRIDIQINHVSLVPGRAESVRLILIVCACALAAAAATPSASFVAPKIFPQTTTPIALVAADFNNDGKLDLAMLSYSLGETGCVCIILGNGDGTFQPAKTNPIPLNPGGSGYLAVGDFNGDGNVDIAAVNEETVEIFLGNGDGTFQTPTGYSAGNNTISVAVGDFNRDGYLDLAVVNNGSNDVSTCLETATVRFKPRFRTR